MKRNLSNRANRSASFREYTFANTCKFVASVVMAMFFTTFFASCNGEKEWIEATAAKQLLTSQIDSTMTLGHTKAWWSGEATTAEAVVIDGSGNLEYRCEKRIYIDALGMPTNVSKNADGTFSSSDGNLFTRDFAWNSTTGVQGSSTPTWERTVILAQLNDSTELVEAQFREDWSVWTNLLPKDIAGSKNGSAIMRVLYERVVKPAAPEPIDPMYRLRAEYVETDGGSSYFNIYAEKSLDNGQSWSKMDEYIDFVGERHGTWRPNVTAQLVSSYEFTTKDSTKEHATEDLRANLGNSKRWSIKNISKIEYFWKDVFNAPADAEGNTTRDIAGTQVQWLNAAVWSNPETGEDMTLNFTGGITTTHSVDESTGIYTRVNSVLCNGEVVETQPGSVQLQLAD